MVEINIIKKTNLVSITGDEVKVVRVGTQTWVVDRRSPRPLLRATQLRQAGFPSRNIVGALKKIGVVARIS